MKKMSKNDSKNQVKSSKTFDIYYFFLYNIPGTFWWRHSFCGIEMIIVANVIGVKVKEGKKLWKHLC